MNKIWNSNYTPYSGNFKRLMEKAVIFISSSTLHPLSLSAISLLNSPSDVFFLHSANLCIHRVTVFINQET